MIQLTLLTGSMHWDNLQRIADDLIKQLPKHDFQINWIICLDQYNGSGSTEAGLLTLQEFCNMGGIRTWLYKSGKPNQKNYGGDLFNDAIFDYLSKKPVDWDPWIYILDDDNLVHPFIFDVLRKCQGNSKRIIWLSKHRETGITDQAPPGMAMNSHWDSGAEFTPAQLSPDPSQLLIRASLIQEVSGYGAGFTYDFEWCLPFCRSHRDEIIFFPEFNPNSIDIIHSYHNALRTKDEYDKDMEMLSDPDSITAQHLYIEGTDEDHKPKIYPLSKELAKIVLQLINHEVRIR
jgi:hypothetical protein